MVHLCNLSPPLAFTIREAESMSVDAGTLWTRTCVFWDKSSRSWETHGVTTVRTNFTDVVCESDHATSFSVARSKEVRPYCTAPIPASFCELGLGASTWWMLFVVLLVYAPCVFHGWADFQDWTPVGSNLDSYFLPPRRRKPPSSVLSRVQFLLGKKKRRRVHTPVLSRMGLKDFADDETPLVVAKLNVETKLKGKKLVTSHVLPFRTGMPLIINPGGATEERVKIANFKTDALITAEPHPLCGREDLRDATADSRSPGRWRQRSRGKDVSRPTYSGGGSVLPFGIRLCERYASACAG